MINDSVLQHVNVESHIKSASAHWRQLAEHDILGDAMTIVLLADRSCFHENLHRLLE